MSSLNKILNRPARLHRLAELIPWNRFLGSGKERANLGGVDELVGETLGDGLDVPEGRLPRARAQQPDGLKNIQNLVNTVYFSDDQDPDCIRMGIRIQT
jgi:hypothetical protein